MAHSRHTVNPESLPTPVGEVAPRDRAKRAMTAAAQACLAGDPAAAEKATRALEQLREAERSEAA